ncbi:hypothetical protein OIU85_010082 [Salix viminalis]|uniref:Uncharacterized protein n=1 Tax=Salix viminalis TaxID=40686 RepID=A0A9Q0NVW1_SALVM|nr:hypothetical protein OIU85_010082 [Salix viminalis]
MPLASNPILSELIAIMLSTATSKKRVRPKAPVISKALLRFLHLILALAAALTLPASGELSIGALDLFSKMGRLLSD